MLILENYRDWLIDLSPRLSGTDSPFRATALLIKTSGCSVRNHTIAAADPHDYVLKNDAVERARIVARAWIDADCLSDDGSRS